MTTSILHLEELTFRYGTTFELGPVNLTVRPGMAVGLIGPNGCGKTTTLRLVAGLLSPSTGSVSLGDIPLEGNHREARRQFSFAPDAPRGFDHLTVLEYLHLYAVLQQADDAYFGRMNRILEVMQLLSHQHRLLSSLSNGTRRKVSITAAISLRRPLFLLDEATSALDPEAVMVLQALLRSTTEGHGSAALISTQDLAFAERVCDIVVLLGAGKMQACGSPSALRTRYGARNLYEVFASVTDMDTLLRNADEALDSSLAG